MNFLYKEVLVLWQEVGICTRRRLLKEISGRVFLETGNRAVANRSEQPLKGVGIRLYVAGNERTSGPGSAGILVRREKLILSTKTDDAGEFRFVVRDGAYSVCLDADTLPSGKCAVKTDGFCKTGMIVKVDFPVSDIASIPVSRRPVRADFCEDFKINKAKMSSADRVRLARRLGMIDERTGIEYLLHALYSRRKLPEDYRSRIPIKSGTGFVNEIRRYIGRPDADPETVRAARQFLISPVPELDKEYRSPGSYFNIHYTLSGENYGVTYSSNVYDKGNSRARVASGSICIDNTYSAQKGFKKSSNYGGSEMIKRIWETQSKGNNNSVGAIDRAIRESYGRWDLGTVFNRFSACNINPAQYYKEGALRSVTA